MKKLILISTLAYCLIIPLSCSLESRVFKNETYVRELLGAPTVVTMYHDSVVEVDVSAPDSGYIYAWFECNDSNKVLLTRYESIKSKGVQTSISYRDNYLRFDFKTDSARIAKSIIDKYSNEKVNTIQVDKPSTLDKLSKLEQKNASKSKAIWILSFVAAGLLMILALLIFKKRS